MCFYGFFHCELQLFQVLILRLVSSEEELRSYQRALRQALTSDWWQITKESVLGDSSHHCNVCQFDFSFLRQGQDTTCREIWFYVHVYGQLGSRDLLSDSSPSTPSNPRLHKEKPALPTATPLQSFITMTPGGESIPASLYPPCLHGEEIMSADRWQLRGIKEHVIWFDHKDYSTETVPALVQGLVQLVNHLRAGCFSTVRQYITVCISYIKSRSSTCGFLLYRPSGGS